MANQEYHYYRLFDDFFQLDEIQILGGLKPDGFYVNLFMRLLGVGAESLGLLITECNTPHTPKTLALKFNYKLEEVEKAFQLYQEYSLINLRESGIYDIPMLLINTGSSKPESDNRRLRRRRKQIIKDGTFMKKKNNRLTYYYMRMQYDFFDSTDIKMLDMMSASDGVQYTRIFIQMILESLKYEGRLMVNEKKQHSALTLAARTGLPLNDIKQALELFESDDFKLIETLDNGVIYIDAIIKYVGEQDKDSYYRREREYYATKMQEKIYIENGIDNPEDYHSQLSNFYQKVSKMKTTKEVEEVVTKLEDTEGGHISTIVRVRDKEEENTKNGHISTIVRDRVRAIEKETSELISSSSVSSDDDTKELPAEPDSSSVPALDADVEFVRQSQEVALYIRKVSKLNEDNISVNPDNQYQLNHIEDRLRDGYTPDQLIEIVDHCAVLYNFPQAYTNLNAGTMFDRQFERFADLLKIKPVNPPQHSKNRFQPKCHAEKHGIPPVTEEEQAELKSMVNNLIKTEFPKSEESPANIINFARTANL